MAATDKRETPAKPLRSPLGRHTTTVLHGTPRSVTVVAARAGVIGPTHPRAAAYPFKASPIVSACP